MYIIIIIIILLGLQDGVQAQGQLQRKDGNDGDGNGHPHRMQHQGQILGKMAVVFYVLCWLSLKINAVGQKTLTPIAALCAKYHPAVYLYCAGLFVWMNTSFEFWRYR